MEKLNVKVGDKVLVHGRYNEEYVSTVEKITPTGLIKVDGKTFYDDGMQRGGDTWYRSCITELTSEDVKRIKDKATIQKAIQLCRDVISHRDTIDIDTANKLIALLEGKVKV